jgi:hypothetical protein
MTAALARASLAAAVVAAALLPPATTTLAAGLPGALQEVGHDDLGARGLNSALALAGRCAYVGSRGQGPVAIVDVSDPAHPQSSGSLAPRALTTTRELRAVPGSRLLVVLSYALAKGGVNRIDLYRWSVDCAHPAQVGGYDFGSRSPHEFFLWQDPAGARTLLFVSMFSGGRDDLQVLDVSDPAAPRLAGTWSPPIGLLHSISLSADGRRAYLSLWTGGLLVADASQFTTGQANPQLSLLTPVAARLPAPPGGNVHSAVQVPGKDLLVVTDERYPPACPYGPARLVDVSNPAQPRALSVMSSPENDPATCQSSPVGTYSSHNPTPVGDLALVSWYSSGLQVFDVSDPVHPQRLAEFRPQASEPGLRDPQLGATLTMTWSYPIVRDGLVYVSDIDEGLYVLRYQGPHSDELARFAFAEGNSNLSAFRQAAPSPSAPVASPSRPAPAASASPAPRSTATALLLTVGVVLLVLAVLGAVASLAFVRRRGPLR